MIRICDGTDEFLQTPDGTRCSCGLRFDDVQRSTVWPHALLALPLSATFTSQEMDQFVKHMHRKKTPEPAREKQAPPPLLSVGVRFPAPAAGRPLAGKQCAVYDVATGELLPCETLSVDASAGGIVTATIKMMVSEVTVAGDDDTQG